MTDPRDWHDARARESLDFDRWYWPRAGFAVFAAFALICAACMPTRSKQLQAVAEPVDAKLTPEEAVTDIRDDGGVPVRRTVPKTPEKWQKRPPCDPEMAEREVFNACYVLTGMRPPCGRLLEYDGACFRAISKPERQPSSVSQ